jgi:PKD repeat protein
VTPVTPAEPLPAAVVPLQMALVSSPTDPSVGTQANFSTWITGVSPVGAVAYQWTFGDGQTATTSEGRVSHPYAVAGSFAVTLRATDSTDRTGEAATTVIVHVPPSAPTTPPPTTPTPTPVVLAATLTCTATAASKPSSCNVAATYGGAAIPSQAITAVTWEWGDGTAVQATAGPLSQHTYTQPGTYALVVTVTATPPTTPPVGIKTANAGRSLVIP